MPCADIHIATMWGGIGWPFIPIICIGGIGAIFGGAFALLAPPLVPDAPPAASLDPPAPLAAGIIGIGHGIGGIGIGFPSGPIGIGGIFPPNGKPIIPIGIPIGPTGIFFRDLPLPMPFGGIGQGIIMGNIAEETIPPSSSSAARGEETLSDLDLDEDEEEDNDEEEEEDEAVSSTNVSTRFSKWASTHAACSSEIPPTVFLRTYATPSLTASMNPGSLLTVPHVLMSSSQKGLANLLFRPSPYSLVPKKNTSTRSLGFLSESATDMVAGHVLGVGVWGRGGERMSGSRASGVGESRSAVPMNICGSC